MKLLKGGINTKIRGGFNDGEKEKLEFLKYSNFYQTQNTLDDKCGGKWEKKSFFSLFTLC